MPPSATRLGRAVFALLLVSFVPGCARRDPSESAPRLDADPAPHVVGVAIEEDIPAGFPLLTEQQIRNWIERAAVAVSHYYGRFPVDRLKIVVTATDEGGVHDGAAYGGGLIRVRLGRDTTPADLDADWVMTHEMFHLGFPEVDEDFHYMEEGLSDYLEPIARARVGQMTQEKAWSDFVHGMPQGQPRPGDKGLDGTGDWGRTYWGGAIFWLVADVRIRERTGNQKSLDDAIRAIVAAGGDGRRHWPLEHVIEVGDRATGTSVLRDVHSELGTKPTRVDLDDLWRRLGVQRRRGSVVCDDGAPLAEIRKSIMSPGTR